MAYQDSHSNTFASALPSAHRCLGFIHAMFALGCLVAPLMATAIASAPGEGDEGWRKVYYLLIGFAALNLLGVAVAFRDSIWQRGSHAQQQQEQKRNKEALTEIWQLLKLKNLWLISSFYFFNAGAWSTAGGLFLFHTVYSAIIKLTVYRLGRRVSHNIPPWQSQIHGIRANRVLGDRKSVV